MSCACIGIWLRSPVAIEWLYPICGNMERDLVASSNDWLSVSSLASRFHCSSPQWQKCRKWFDPDSRGSSQWYGRVSAQCSAVTATTAFSVAESEARDDAMMDAAGPGHVKSRGRVACWANGCASPATKALRQITTRHRHITLFPTRWGSAWRAWAVPTDGITFGPLLRGPFPPPATPPRRLPSMAKTVAARLQFLAAGAIHRILALRVRTCTLHSGTQWSPFELNKLPHSSLPSR